MTFEDTNYDAKEIRNWIYGTKMLDRPCVFCISVSMTKKKLATNAHGNERGTFNYKWIKTVRS